MGSGVFVPPGMTNDPGISGQDSPSPALSGNTAIALQKLQALMQGYAAQMGLTGGKVKTGEVSPARVPNVTGTVPTGGGGAVPTPTFQPNRPMPMRYEFQTAAGKNAQNAYNLLQGVSQGVEKIRAKKAQEQANEGYLITSFYLDAYKRGDQRMMNSIAENPKYQKILEKAFGTKLPTMGKKEAKPEKPNPTKDGALKAIQQHAQGGQGPVNLPAPQTPVEANAAAQQAALKGRMAAAANQQMNQPGVAANVGKAALGQELTPVERQQMEAQAGKVLLQTEGEMAKIVSDQDIALQTNLAKLKSAQMGAESRTKAAATTSAARILAAEIAADGRIKSAGMRANASLRAGMVSKAIPNLIDVGKAYLDKASDLTNPKLGNKARHFDDKDIQMLYQNAEKMFSMAGDLSKASAMPQEDQWMGAVAKKYQFKMSGSANGPQNSSR